MVVVIIIARCWCWIRHKLGRSNSTQDSHTTTTSSSSRSSLFKSIVPPSIRSRIWPPPDPTAGHYRAHARHNPANSIETLPPYPGPDGPPNYNQIFRHPRVYIMFHIPLFIAMRRHHHDIDVVEGGGLGNPDIGPRTVTLHFMPPTNNIPTEPPPIYYYTGIHHVQSAHQPATAATALRAPTPRASAGPVEQHLIRNNY